MRRQKAAAKALGVPGPRGNEETWGDPVFGDEVKSGAQTAPALRVLQRAEAQALAARATHGDRGRPIRVTLIPDGTSGAAGAWTAVRLEAWREHIAPSLAETHGP